MSSIFSNFNAYLSSGENIGKIAKGGSKIASKLSLLAIKFFLNKPLVAATLAFTALALWGKHKYSKLEKELATSKTANENLAEELATSKTANENLCKQLANPTGEETASYDNLLKMQNDQIKLLQAELEKIKTRPKIDAASRSGSPQAVDQIQSLPALFSQNIHPFKIIANAILPR